MDGVGHPGPRSRKQTPRPDAAACAAPPAPDRLHGWRADVMADERDPAAARRKLGARPDALVCDALLDQDVGVQMPPRPPQDAGERP